ncbi:lipopolysaccharide biosynthesis protein [Deefgea sp. CFH1-16]|uniref:lipopolysaccharide biosynthesis protein n=1 Tax=Deefgea sp. CFH1-16 TaxID=2675457 RepID=UPI0015F38DDA|nr:oligosaccharide flippase family protein [Deefgea sp. CFH1-16]MBM5573553.1 oligosaccharide flippase family protein [Deefgea sp. CFH1-16]
MQSVFRRKGLVDLVMLFFSKAGGVLVGVVFLPLYSKLLGVDQFSVLVVILSIQALLLMLDFGMATIVGRELAMESEPIEKINTYFSSIAFLTLIYMVVTFLFISAHGFFDYLNEITIGNFLLAITLFFTSVLQNTITTALISIQKYKLASAIQAVAVLIKAICTLLVLKYVTSSVNGFLIVHCSLGILHVLILHRVFIGINTFKDCRNRGRITLAGLKKVAMSGRPLFLFGVAGALALQADKLIISHYMSAAEVSAYFFAMTFCMTPLAILGGPIAQYFQPKIVSAVTQIKNEEILHLVKYFVFAMIGVILSISIFLLFFRDDILNMWLSSFPFVPLVSKYVAILMPGLAIGALGFIPFVFLTSIQDFNFQARISVLLTMILIFCIFIGSWLNRLDFICVSYAIYHSCSTILSWGRSVMLRQVRRYTVYAASLAIGPVLLFLIICLFLLK